MISVGLTESGQRCKLAKLYLEQSANPRISVQLTDGTWWCVIALFRPEQGPEDFTLMNENTFGGGEYQTQQCHYI